MLITFVLELTLVAALIIAIHWFRGHAGTGLPICRACRFDLTGLRAARCPECGADLSLRGAIRTDRKRRSHRLLLLAAALFVGVLSVAGYHILRAPKPEEWRSYEPTWWLMRDTRSSDPAVVGPVLRELLRRYEAGTLSDSTLRTLARQGLRYRDEGAPCIWWNWEYGNFLDIAWSRGLLSAEERRNYAENCVGLRWSGPLFRTYENAPNNPVFSISLIPYVGNESRSAAAAPPVDFVVDTISVSIDGEELPTDFRLHPAINDPSRTAFAVASTELPKEWQGRSLTVYWRLQTVDPTTRQPIGAPWEDQRVVKLTSPLRGGARRQDASVPPDISRM